MSTLESWLISVNYGFWRLILVPIIKVGLVTSKDIKFSEIYLLEKFEVLFCYIGIAPIRG